RIRAGMIGEVGVSPEFTDGERTSLRAAALAQHESSGTAMNIHMPGWQRRGEEVLDIAVGEMGADPTCLSLAHSDPSGEDVDYQRRLLDRGVWLEFDMIGLDITFPGEGASPAIAETADAVARLIDLGYADQILLSHDLFLKQMWRSMGGNGFILVPTAFLELLVARGVERSVARQLITGNPQRYLAGGAAGSKPALYPASPRRTTTPRAGSSSSDPPTWILCSRSHVTRCPVRHSRAPGRDAPPAARVRTRPVLLLAWAD